MDADSFRKSLEVSVDKRLKTYQLHIDMDNLPTSVEFTVTSEEFKGVDPSDRIQFLADIVEEAFGLPLDFRPVGLALTHQEASSGKWNHVQDEDSLLLSNDKGSAASALD